MALSQFLKVRTTTDITNFKLAWPTFFPDAFWQWQINPAPPGPVDSDEPLPQLAPVSGWRAWQTVLREAWSEKFPLTETIRLLVSPTAPWRDELADMPVFDFQRAILLLSVERWRAKFCLQCGEPFAAEKPATRFCNPECFGLSRRVYKRQWFRENLAKTTERRK
jgi:hypothetical protein